MQFGGEQRAIHTVYEWQTGKELAGLDTPVLFRQKPDPVSVGVRLFCHTISRDKASPAGASGSGRAIILLEDREVCEHRVDGDGDDQENDTGHSRMLPGGHVDGFHVFLNELLLAR